jgi:lipoyl synthase
VLTPDFHARIELISRICDAGPTVFNHNIETVRRLTHQVRPQARYERSLEVLKSVKRCAPAMTVKSGVMLGLGESIEEVITTLQDLRRMDVDVVTIGQYLKPSEGRLEIEKFIHPEVFSDLERVGNEMGFSEVYSGPYVRSSYHAGEVYSRSLSIV